MKNTCKHKQHSWPIWHEFIQNGRPIVRGPNGFPGESSVRRREFLMRCRLCKKARGLMRCRLCKKAGVLMRCMLCKKAGVLMRGKKAT